MGGEGRSASGGAAGRRRDREPPPGRPDFAGERHGPLPEVSADIDHDRAGLQKPEDGRMDMWRVEEGMATAGVEWARHMDQIAGPVQHQSAGPVPFEPREEALLAPSPD